MDSLKNLVCKIFHPEKQFAVTDKKDSTPSFSHFQTSTRTEQQNLPSVNHKYAGFDLEIAKIIDGGFSEWRSQRPLGISCAALYTLGHSPEIWYGRDSDGKPALRIDRSLAIKLVHSLLNRVENGFKIVTWNGLGFDFDVLAEESKMWEECRFLGLEHIDIMFHILCIKGYPIKLDKAAKGMGLAGKIAGVTGDKAPELWQKGSYETVLEYVAQDSRTTVEVASMINNYGYLDWTSNSGKPQNVYFPDGLLTVREAMKLPLPDTSWMQDPMSREQFLDWTFHKSNIYIIPDGIPRNSIYPDIEGSESDIVLNTEDSLIDKINAILSEAESFDKGLEN